MIRIIHESRQKARKDYYCNACEFLFEDEIVDLGLTFSEYRSVVKAKWNGRRILKGEIYVRQFNTDNGHAWTFRAIPEIHKICVKYNIYQY